MPTIVQDPFLQGSRESHPAHHDPGGIAAVGEAALEAQAALAELASRAADYRDRAIGTVRRHPVATIAAALGVGFVLGGGLASRSGLRLLGMAGRMAAAVMLRQALHGVADRDAF